VIKSLGTERSSDQGQFSPIKILDPGRQHCMMACMPSVMVPLHN